LSIKKVQTRIQNKHDLEINWNKASFIPLAGELIIYEKEVDRQGNTLTMLVDGLVVPALPEGRSTPYTYERFKVGDGIKQINDLPFVVEEITSEEIEALFQEVFSEEFTTVQATQTIQTLTTDGSGGWLPNESNSSI
jgi:hypothetical protein